MNIKIFEYNNSPRAIGLVVWFLFWVQEVPGSIPGSPLFYITQKNQLWSPSTLSFSHFLFHSIILCLTSFINKDLFNNVYIKWIYNRLEIALDQTQGKDQDLDKNQSQATRDKSIIKKIKNNLRLINKLSDLYYVLNRIENNP